MVLSHTRIRHIHLRDWFHSVNQIVQKHTVAGSMHTGSAESAIASTSRVKITTPETAGSKPGVERSHTRTDVAPNDTGTMPRPGQSRENTPSTLSSHSLDTAPLDRTTSSASASVSMEEGSGSSFGQASQETQNDEEVERFLRKIDMEKVSWRPRLEGHCSLAG